jgi:hypothetical protein
VGIYIEKIKGPLLYELKRTPAEYKADLDLASPKGWLELRERVPLFGSRRPAPRCSLRERVLLQARQMSALRD